MVASPKLRHIARSLSSSIKLSSFDLRVVCGSNIRASPRGIFAAPTSKLAWIDKARWDDRANTHIERIGWSEICVFFVCVWNVNRNNRFWFELAKHARSIQRQWYAIGLRCFFFFRFSFYHIFFWPTHTAIYFGL